ncbi:MAG: hypothetical protein ABIH82_04310 [Candidatus Woesearchaeota archaeon]
MIWQDLVITCSIVLFAASLIPQVYLGFKKKKGYITLKTSIPTFVGLVTIMFAYLSLELYFSTIVGFITAFLWFLLLVQRLVYQKV